MEPKNVFLFLSLLPILFGVFILIAAIKNWGKNMTPRKLVYKIIREALGEKGTRIFGGLAGIGLILYGGFIFSTMYMAYNPFSQKNKQTDNIRIEKKTIIDGNTTTSSTLYLTIPVLEQNVKLGGDAILNEYVKVSFRNNHLTSIPDIVWKMKNLEEIDLTNNKISNLSLENLTNLNNMRVLILTDNPIDKSEIERLQNEMNIEIKY